MNNIYKVLIAFAVGLLAGWLLFGGSVLGGVTNYDSLQLQPSSSSDDALDVRDSGGTSRFVVDGSGASSFTGTVDITGELQTARIVIGGGVLAIGSVATSGPSAAQVCNNAGATLTMTATSGAMTFAAAEDFFSDCLESDGKSIFWKISNLGTATTSAQLTVTSASTTMVAAADLVAGDADLLTGGQSMLLEFYRESATKLIIFIHSKFADSD